MDFRRLVRARLMYREAAEPPYAISSMRMNRTYRGVHVRVVMRGDACHFGSERSSFACLLRCLRALHRIQPCWWHEGASSTVERPVTICLATGAMLVMSVASTATAVPSKPLRRTKNRTSSSSKPPQPAPSARPYSFDGHTILPENEHTNWKLPQGS